MNTSMTTTKSSASIARRIAALSATECAGLPDSTIIARKRSGWSVRISSGITLHGTRPPKMRAPATGLRGALPGSSSPEYARTSGTMLDGAYWPPGTAKLPVSTQTSFSR